MTRALEELVSTSAWLTLLHWLLGAIGLTVLLLGILIAVDWLRRNGESATHECEARRKAQGPQREDRR